MLLIAWTTVATRADADKLASGAIAERLAACAQVDGPITSYYTWQGKLESSQEFRLTFKLLPEQSTALENWIVDRHPYDTPEWVITKAEHVSGKYLSWTRSTLNH